MPHARLARRSRGPLARAAAALSLPALAAALVAPVLAGPLAAPAAAASPAECSGGAFALRLPSGRTVRSDAKISARELPPGSTVAVRGAYVEFDVAVSTLGVTDYTLTGKANPADMTGGVRTPVFAAKTPDLGGRTLDDGTLEVRARDGDLRLVRRGAAGSMKIQAKDCAQGGIFQMEPEAGAAVTVTHVLAPGMSYFRNPYTGKINFGNGTLLRGKDSPQVATLLSQTETTSSWSVASGGRMGGVLGEDAVELSAGASPCVQDCQAQNRVRGTLPVTDPAYAG